MTTWTRTLAVLAGSAWLVACCGDKQDGTATDTDEPTAADGGGDGTAEEAAAGPEWEIPEKDVPGSAGDTVMAVSPVGDDWEAVAWMVGEIKEIEGTSAVFVPGSQTERPRTPGAVIVPVPDDPQLKAGDIVFGDVEGRCQLARVERIDGDRVTARTVVEGEPRDVEMTVGGDLIKAVATLRATGMAVYPEAGAQFLGQVAYVDPETALVISNAGTVVQPPRGSVVPVNPFWIYKVGNEVYAAGPGGKLFGAKITEVIDDGLLYEVEFQGTDAPAEGPQRKAFWEITKSLSLGPKFRGAHGDVVEDSTPAQTYSDGEGEVKRGGRSEGGRTAVPVARPKR